MITTLSRAGPISNAAWGILLFAVGATGCADETITIRVRDPHAVGVSLRTATGSVPILEPGSDRRVMDPVPVQGGTYPDAHVSREANGTIDFCCSSIEGPNLAADPIVLKHWGVWPSRPTIHTGDALRVPFDYTTSVRRHGSTVAPLEMVTPWSNVISVHNSRRVDRGGAFAALGLGAAFAGLGAALEAPESRYFTPYASIGFIAFGSTLLIAGLAVLLAPNYETDWRSGDR